MDKVNFSAGEREGGLGHLSQRLDEMELAIHKPSFRKGTGRANEVNYWVFDYPPEKELEVRERVEYLKNKNDRGDDDFELVVFDLYDIIIDFLEKKNFMEKCYDFEKKRGIERIVKAVTNSMKVNDDDSLIIMEAAKKASIHDFIMTLPNGYGTEVGELGDTLSGGEKQRIGIARAFLHDASMILLDEPTSNLDSLNEGIILKSLKESAEEKTIVLVSHRVSTMNVANVVYEMENGRIS